MNWLDVVIILLSVWFVIKGFKDGLIMSVVKLIALIAGIWVSIKFSYMILQACLLKFPGLQDNVGSMSQTLVRILAFIVVFVLVVLLIKLIGWILTKIINVVSLSAINKIFGAVFGFFKGLLLVSVLLYVLNAFNILVPIIKPEVRYKSFFYEKVEKMVPSINKLVKKT